MNRDDRRRGQFVGRNEREHSNARDRYLAGTRAEPARSKKRRGVMEFDETGVLRKKVRGGRIAKLQKTREGETTVLFCEVCEKYLQDGNSKAAHDKGRDHLRKIEERREQEEKETMEMARKQEEQTMDVELPQKAQNSVMPVSKVKELSAKMKEDKSRPKSFQTWCERSIKHAEKNHLLGVQREILYEYSFHLDNGTLLSESWDRKRLATGKCFLDTTPQVYKDPEISEDQLRKLYSEAPMTLDIPIPAAEDEIAPVAPEADALPAPGRDYPAVVFVPGRNVEADKDVQVISEESAPLTPLVKVDITWKLCKHARALIACHNVYGPETAIEKFRMRHANVIVDKDRSSGMQPVPNRLRKVAWCKYEELKKSYDDEDYDAADLEKDCMKLIHEIHNYRGNSRLLRNVWSVIARVNISSMKWAKIITPLSRLMELYKGPSADAESKSEFVGHWILTLLLKEAGGAANNYLDMRLSSLHKSMFNFEGMRYGLRVLRAILQNNYVAFLSYINYSEFHLDTENRSNYLLQSLLPMVRQRALLLWGAVAPSTESLTYQNTNKIDFRQVLDRLEYFDEPTPGTRIWLADEARVLIERMGLWLPNIEGQEPQDDGGGQVLHGSPHCNPNVVLEPFINGKAIFGFTRPENCVFLKDQVMVE